MRVTTLVAVLFLALGGCGGGSAGGARISGFQPIDPPVGFRLTASLHSPMALSEPVVDSLQPTLKWEGMPGRHERHAGDRTPFVRASAERISDVTWEVEVYEAEDDGWRGGLVWRGEGLSEPQATISTPLKPGQLYLWTVRASFLLDGESRKSEWSVALWQRVHGPSFWTAYNERDMARASGSIPDGSMYRFRTPKVP